MSSRRGPPPKWEEEQCLEVLRRYEAHCVETGETPTVDGYTLWHEQHPDSSPAATTLIRVGKSWNRLRQNAANSPDEVELNHPRWTEKRCLSALHRYQVEQEQAGNKVTFLGYAAWQSERKDAPSPNTIKHVTGSSWKNIVRKASTHAENEQTR